MGRNLTAWLVGIHTKIHANTQILTKRVGAVVQMRQMLTTALTSSAIFEAQLQGARFLWAQTSMI